VSACVRACVCVCVCVLRVCKSLNGRLRQPCPSESWWDCWRGKKFRESVCCVCEREERERKCVLGLGGEVNGANPFFETDIVIYKNLNDQKIGSAL